jgi:hypothetical protein
MGCGSSGGTGRSGPEAGESPVTTGLSGRRRSLWSSGKRVNPSSRPGGHATSGLGRGSRPGQNAGQPRPPPPGPPATRGILPHSRRAAPSPWAPTPAHSPRPPTRPSATSATRRSKHLTVQRGAMSTATNADGKGIGYSGTPKGRFHFCGDGQPAAAGRTHGSASIREQDSASSCTDCCKARKAYIRQAPSGRPPGSFRRADAARVSQHPSDLQTGTCRRDASGPLSLTALSSPGFASTNGVARDCGRTTGAGSSGGP